MSHAYISPPNKEPTPLSVIGSGFFELTFLSFLDDRGSDAGCHGGTSGVVLQITNRSTNSLTGVASRRFGSRHSSRIASRRCFGKRRARFLRNFSSSKGMPSLRRRRWQRGYSSATLRDMGPYL